MNAESAKGGRKGRLHAVLFRSPERFESFRQKIGDYGLDCTVLDFDRPEWMDFDYTAADILIYYPSFEQSSNYPLALSRVSDNLGFLHREYPHMAFYPDPHVIRYYNDKYRQFLFLKKNGFPMPDTVPLLSGQCLDQADASLGYPMVVKNRFGAGGASVFRINSKKELKEYYRLSRFDLFNRAGFKHAVRVLGRRGFYYWLIRARQMQYPFLSYPMLAQEFVPIERDLKIVVNSERVVEGHWRYRADSTMWKMNIDGGGTGVWGYIPDSALAIAVNLARKLKARWLNLDLIESRGKFLISEFSPVWHHYAYREKPDFVYRDDYNIDVPLSVSLDLERIIVESLIRAARPDESYSEESNRKR